MVKTNSQTNGPLVVGIEHIHDLAESSVVNLNKSYGPEMQSGKIKIVVGDGRLGYAQDAPYDAIHAGCGTQ